MQQFLAADAWASISMRAQASREPSKVAVAYFSENGDRMLPLIDGSKIIVDATKPTVSAGLTSPHALLRLKKRGVSIFSTLHLHAKTFLFDNKYTISGSCNASSRSQSVLIEAAIITDSRSVYRDASNFLESLSVNELDENKLLDLCSVYKAPKTKAVSSQIIQGQTLVMDLLQEQGGRRASQVQPPRAIWEQYLGRKWLVSSQKSIALESVADGRVYHRPVVIHDHNMTIEVVGAELPRPAILILKRLSKDRYSYRVIRPNHATFPMFDSVLNLENPLQTAGARRRWQIV